MKHKFKIIPIIVTAILLAGCGREALSTSEKTSAENVTASKEDWELSEGTDEETAFDLSLYFSADEVMQLYTNYLKSLYPLDSEDAENIRYYLAKINEDDIPELLYMEGDYHSAGVHVLVCDSDGNVLDVGEFGEYGSFSYIPGKGEIISFYMNSGIYFIDFYSLSGLSLTDDIYFEVDEAVIDNESDRYYVDGDEVTKEEYNAKYSEKNNGDFVSLDYEDALSYAMTDDLLRVLKEFAQTGKAPSIINPSTEMPEIVGDFTPVTFKAGSSGESFSVDEAGISARLFVSDYGNVTFTMEYEGVLIEDYPMAITDVYSEYPGAIKQAAKCANADGTREYVIYESALNTITVELMDYAETYSDYAFTLTFTKTEE